MTCEICVMNRHAAVLAADSASTVTRWVDGKVETRYFKGANKIFQLSHHQPVGLMVFNAADLLQVPWEILIKGFRDELGGKTFNDLDGYAAEFFAFLDGNARFFPEHVQGEQLASAAQTAAFQMLFSVVDDLGKLKDPANLGALAGAIQTRLKLLEGIPLANRITPDQALRAIAAHRDKIAERLSFLDLPEDHKQSLVDLAITEAFKRPDELFGTAGLVVAGFGEHDIFPKAIQYQASGMLEGTLIVIEVSRDVIDHSTPASLRPFAQTSMSDTFSVGFSKDVYMSIMGLLNEKLREFATTICTAVRADITALGSLDAMVDAAQKSISDGWFERSNREHAYPLRRVLGDLPVEEMAELAETLVNLQSLKEKVTKPSASVGGPVDVAIITKIEGLVWIKRKLFFDSQLNPRYQYRLQAKYG